MAAGVDFNPFPLLNIIQEDLPVIAQSKGAKGVINILDSSALASVTTATLKNIPYTFLSEETSFYQEMTSRMRYLESGLMSVASLVHSVAFAAVFTVLAAVTFGQVQAINDLFVREWMHTGLAIGSTIASVVGTIIPKFGTGANAAVALLSTAAVFIIAQRDTVNTIKGIYLRNRERFEPACRQMVGNDDEAYNQLIRPVLSFVDRNIESVESYEDFLEFSGNVFDRLPQEVHQLIDGGLEAVGEILGE